MRVTPASSRERSSRQRFTVARMEWNKGKWPQRWPIKAVSFQANVDASKPVWELFCCYYIGLNNAHLQFREFVFTAADRVCRMFYVTDIQC